MLGTKNFKDERSSIIYLVDYGICSMYQDIKGVHLPLSTEENRAGCVLFASQNLWRKKKLSWRDDLISLVYLLVFFITGELAFLELGEPPKLDKKAIGEKKKAAKPKNICVGKA